MRREGSHGADLTVVTCWLSTRRLVESIMRVSTELRELKSDLAAAADSLPAKTVKAFLHERR